MPVFQRERLTRAEITVVRAVATLAGRRGAPVLVGGAVRDAWLGRRPGREVDLDVAVPAGALDLARRGGGGLPGPFFPPAPGAGPGGGGPPGGPPAAPPFPGPPPPPDPPAPAFPAN